MKAELVNNKAKEAIYQLQYYKILYLAHKKVNIKNIDTFFNNNYLLDCNSRLLLFKI